MRLLYTLVFLLLTTIVYGQNSILFQNVNNRAKELKHNLNASGDSIIFECERTIYEVVIFNDDFQRTIKVRNTEVKIPIEDIPVGRYVVETLLRDKLIVNTLVRNEPFDLPEPAALVTDNSGFVGGEILPNKAVMAHVESNKDKEGNAVAVTEESPSTSNMTFGSESTIKETDLAVAGKKASDLTKEAGQNAKNRNDLSLSTTKGKVTEKSAELLSSEVELAKTNRVVRTYWVIYKMNNGHRSEKIQKLSDQETVDRMIKKNEIDLKTKSGRLNELSIWAIYNPSEFVQHKRKNRRNYLDVDSESFNNIPYYNNVNVAE